MDENAERVGKSIFEQQTGHRRKERALHPTRPAQTGYRIHSFNRRVITIIRDGQFCRIKLKLDLLMHYLASKSTPSTMLLVAGSSSSRSLMGLQNEYCLWRAQAHRRILQQPYDYNVLKRPQHLAKPHLLFLVRGKIHRQERKGVPQILEVCLRLPQPLPHGPGAVELTIQT